MNSIVSTTYFGPIQWYQKLNRSEKTWIERYDNYQKQSYRNRCVIATTNGLQALTVPVERPAEGLHRTWVRDLRISDHGNWRHLHWQALMSAYGESPFFEYYADDIRPYFERKWEYLFDFNMDICHTMCDLLDIRPIIEPTDDYRHDFPEGIVDYREVIHPKHPGEDATFEIRPYYQVYGQKHGFQANLSILDLLFNMGPEGIFYL